MKHLALIIAAASFACAQTNTQPVNTMIQGSIFHSQSNIHPNKVLLPILKACVTLKNADTTFTTQTDSTGNFRIDLKPVGIVQSHSVFKSGSITISGQKMSLVGVDAKAVAIHDLRGRALFQQLLAMNQNNIALPNLAEGQHLLTITARSGETKTVQFYRNLSLSFGAVEESTTNHRGSRSFRAVDSLPDTITIAASGYPKVTMPINVSKTTVAQNIIMIDSSRGSASSIVIGRLQTPVKPGYQPFIPIDTIDNEGNINFFFNVSLLYNDLSMTPITPHQRSANKVLTANAPGFYTSILNPMQCISYATDSLSAIFKTTVDLDSIPEYATSLSGSVILDESQKNTSKSLCYPRWYTNSDPYNSYNVILYAKDSVTALDTVEAKECGRFQFENVPEGSYVLKLNRWERVNGGTVKISTKDSRKIDLLGEFYLMTVAPNIYLYPESKSYISVNVNIRENGSIPFSIPTYGNGWNVMATPEGKINDSLGFLYYDFISPIAYQSDSGWVLSYKNFDSEVSQLLSARGLNKQEILDFIDFWKKYIPACDWVTLCPTDANRMVELTVKPTPKTLFRELYLVLPSNGTKPTIKEPSRGTPFVRKGFTVVEWGGHLEGLELNQVIKDKTK